MIDVETGARWDTNVSNSAHNPGLDQGDKISRTRGCCTDDHGSVNNLIGESTTAAEFIVTYVGCGETAPRAHKNEFPNHCTADVQ